MSFIDSIELELTAGTGGDGVVRWRQEKYIPRGGPAGGDGGRGGSVYLQGVKNNLQLAQYQGNKRLSAGSGEAGGSKSLYGQKGDDLIVAVPTGTLVTNVSTGDSFEILNPEETVKILDGGRGGLGNIHFKSSTNQTPKESTKGKPGETGLFKFELQLIADAGLVGYPNAGKSTLINFLTNSKSKVAPYEFTTLEPHLGTFYEFVLADIPGLISGASTGKGLGYKFLQHINRTGLLLHCVALDDPDPFARYNEIRTELKEYSSNLYEKPELVVLTKSDLVDAEVVKEVKQKFPADSIVVSVLDDASLKDFSDTLARKLREQNSL